MDRPRPRDVILRKLDDGTLPTKTPNKIYTDYGSGATCDACGDPLQSAQVELSCPDEHRTFRMHLSCAALWEAVRVTRGPDPAL
jgi:hypothetical protein